MNMQELKKSDGGEGVRKREIEKQKTRLREIWKMEDGVNNVVREGLKRAIPLIPTMAPLWHRWNEQVSMSSYVCPSKYPTPFNVHTARVNIALHVCFAEWKKKTYADQGTQKNICTSVKSLETRNYHSRTRLQILYGTMLQWKNKKNIRLLW